MQSVGTNKARLDARSKADGSARYADDYKFPGLLHAAIVPSRRAHARILNVDTSGALAMEGVHGVYTAKDIPGTNLIPLIIPDLTLLVDDKARYVGDPIAVVVADTPERARKAAGAVEVEYRELPAIFDMHEAMGDEAPLVHATGNVFTRLKIRKGDVESGFEEADVVIDEEYRTPGQEHAYLEAQGMIAVPQPDGGMTVYGSMQCPFYCHKAVARILGFPMSRLRMVQTATGGGFGGKEDVPSIVAGLAALAAHRVDRPVKLVYNRQEDMEMMSKRHLGWVRMKTGVTRDGDITAMEIQIRLDGGAYATLSPAVIWRATVHSPGPYRCDNIKVDSWALATNKVPAGAFRGFGTLQVIFAHEQQMDRMARAIEMDPLEFRLRNALRIGDETATNQVLKESVGLTETLERAAEASDYKKKRELYQSRKDGSKRRGIGIGTIFYGVGLGAKGKYIDRTGALVQVAEDATARVSIGNAEMGQGLRTVVSQICAEQLGLEYEKVYTTDSDTSNVPDSGPTVASRATVMSGNAVVDACRKIRKELFKLGAELLDTGPDSLVIRERRLETEDGTRGMPMDELIAEAHARRLDLIAHGYTLPQPTSFDDETGMGTPYEVYSYATNICEVEVDTETGEVTVLDFYAAHDVGKAINPALVEGQIQGGTVQGLGFALTEEVIYEKGRILNPRFATYIIPTMADVPPIHPIIVEHPYSRGPYGAKGVGEPPIMGVAPAVINAIRDACGVWLTECPATPERVFAALEEHEGGTE